jgi:single-stranded-DNA-specific exonuclease
MKVMKVAILTHADCDGMCAGAIALAKFPDASVFFTKPVSLKKDLPAVDAELIIICDIALTKSDAAEISKILIEKSKSAKITYFDHHMIPSTADEEALAAIEHVHKLNVSASELIYKHYHKDLPKERVWIALYGAIGDYEDDTPFVHERMMNWDRRALYFEVSTLIMGIKEKEFSSYDAKRRIVQTMSLGKNPSDVAGLVSAAKDAVNQEFKLYDYIKTHAEKRGRIGVVSHLPECGFRGPAALFAATVTDTAVGLYLWEKENYVDVTARKRNSPVQLNIVMEEAAELVGGSGGGHPAAAGARIPKDKLDKFIHQVNKLVA